MAVLELRLLGDLEVIRDGRAVPLPPSKKTRALLAYLALHDRPFRRETLCELLWEIPDDPRGSLRWSLSKLRRLVDDEDRRRIIADRNSVQFDDTDVRIDVREMARIVAGDLDRLPVAELEAAVARRGVFLEGLELSNFHDFHAWCMAEREAAARSQARILEALAARHAGDPERALEYARALVAMSPYDESARANLIGLLTGAGRIADARRQHDLGMRMLDEIGVPSTGALARALKGAVPDAVPPAPAGPVPPPESRTADHGPLVGREPEMVRIRSILERLRQGDGGFLLLSGEPGIGKSRLLEAARGLAVQAGAWLLEACAFESETIRPFAIWIDALRRSGTDTAKRVFGGDDQANREQLLGRLNDLVTRQSAERPAVLIFDDVQWGDESSAAALHYVARMTHGLPVLGLLAARESELHDNGPMLRALRELKRAGHLQEVRLGPLSEAAVRKLIGQRAPSVDSRRLSEQCAGNPLLAVELARAEEVGDTGGSLDELLRERVARLDVEGADVIRWASVLAPRVDAAMLERLTVIDANRIGEVLENAARQSILVPAERGYRFSHDLVARSIYKDISPARRQLMHRRVSELLEQDTLRDLERAADLTHHASLSGDPALAARAMVSAGRLCLRFFANEEAYTLAGRGLDLVDQLEVAERVCLTLELRDVMLTAALPRDWETAAGEFVALAEQALDLGELSHARLGYSMASYVRWMHGQWSGAREEILQSERVTRGASEEDHIVGMAEAAKCLAMLERDLTRADAMLMEAQALAARRRMSHYAIPAALGMLRYYENRLDEAEELFKQARTLAKSAGDRINEYQANEYLAMLELERGNCSAACAHSAALLEIGNRLREGSEAPFARALDGLCRYSREQIGDDFEAALEELRIADAKHRLAYILNRAALLDLEQDRFDDARARATEALDYARVLDRNTEIVLAHVVLARACRAVDDQAGHRQHAAMLADLGAVPVAEWAHRRAVELISAAGR